MSTKTVEKSLCQAAICAMKNAYCPYSGYSVGAALLTKSGKIFTGCNIENASYTPTVCAERSAIFSAVSAGETDFLMIAVAGGHGGEISTGATPCGVCRQVMAEFCNDDFKIIVVKDSKAQHFEEYTLSELLPHLFGAKNLGV